MKSLWSQIQNFADAKEYAFGSGTKVPANLDEEQEVGSAD